MVTRRLFRLAVAWACGLVACMPPPLDETGKRCSAERPCSDDFVCIAERCQWADAGNGLEDAGVDAGPDAGLDAGADAGPAHDGGPDGGLDAGTDGGSDGGADAGPVIPIGRNLLANPGFELELSDGGIRFWRQGNGVGQPSSPAKSGAQALRLTGQPNTGPFVTSEFIRGSTSFPMLFCARVCAGTSSMPATASPSPFGSGSSTAAPTAAAASRPAPFVTAAGSW